MPARSILIGLSVLIVVAGAPAALATKEEAAKAFVAGQDLLPKGDFDGALKAYKAAAQGDPSNTDYGQEFALLRRIVEMRGKLAGEQDADAWQSMAGALYSYYREHRIHGEALTLAGQIHAKLKNADSATLLADAQLAADKNAEAVALLSGLAPDQRTPLLTALHGVALARLGKTADAQAMAGKVELPKDGGPEVCFAAARLHALVGHTAQALEALKCGFETTTPDQLDAVRAEVKESKDLRGLASSAQFAHVLKTESKAKTACGMGPDCGKCPLKGKEGAAKDGEKKDAGRPEHDKAKSAGEGQAKKADKR